jgi:hypothetical protein
MVFDLIIGAQRIGSNLVPTGCTARYLQAREQSHGYLNVQLTA